MTNDIIEHKPILAKIQLQNSLGLSSWYEVICWEDNVWKRFDSNEKYFTNGEQIVEWNYCEDCLSYSKEPIAYYEGVEFSRYTISWGDYSYPENTPLYFKKEKQRNLKIISSGSLQ